MAIKLTSTAHAGANGVKVLVYGRAGVGKTVLCATAPKPLIIQCEGGLLSLRRVDIPVIDITSVSDLQEALRFARKRKADKYKTICLDSISDIAERILKEAKRTYKDNRQAYGELVTNMMDIIYSFRDLIGKNVYFSAKETAVIDSGVTRYVPSMPGSRLGPELPYYFDEVFRLIVTTKGGKKKRILVTDTDLETEAKDRSGVLDKHEPPNLKKIFRKIMVS